jgi:hypothetical protein
MRGAAAALLALSTLHCVDGAAATPRFADIVLSDSRDGSAVSTFKPTTPKVYLRANLLDVAPGSKVKGDWIAVKTDVAPPNYRIDGAELNITKGMTRVDYTMSRPTKGWPEGDYRVDLFINGKKATDVKFKVAK